VVAFDLALATDLDVHIQWENGGLLLGIVFPLISVYKIRKKFAFAPAIFVSQIFSIGFATELDQGFRSFHLASSSRI
jgi:hypothetical protein